ncbi:class I SAM-dependent methyltransferase [Azospirillum picis]|uniref:SAM-dependent methyltransferase n=1 Tax=Azospirillum picis TaxID=488438 RepID=A0ABU0MUU9_9PROT|nr:class I SAM-dependent methyltransferase [Azospirillum picis]MBP2303224.1 SAM-dependent methyltransferase [Azospirillum picis]MDQ0536969.1 SAM-dependent methyltransferase [Azospirillum picis]
MCGHSDGNRRHTAREMMFGRRDRFDYVECAGCGCLQIEAIPDNLADYYSESYYSLSGSFDQEFSDPKRRRSHGLRARLLLTLPEVLAKRVRFADMRRPLWSLRPVLPPRRGRILDVGCGAGRLLYLLSLAGWRRGHGVDPFLKEDLHYANGLTVQRGTLDEVDGGWDLIMFHHSFEHVPDPLASLRSAARRLTQTGTCLLRIPVADCEAWRRYGPDWVQLDAPRHLHLFTRKSIDILAARAGLRVVGVAHDSYEFQFWGSEQYRQDIPLFADGSFRWGSGAPIFSPAQIRQWQEDSERLNRAGAGDQAVFYLKPASGRG